MTCRRRHQQDRYPFYRLPPPTAAEVLAWLTVKRKGYVEYAYYRRVRPPLWSYWSISHLFHDQARALTRSKRNRLTFPKREGWGERIADRNRSTRQGPPDLENA